MESPDAGRGWWRWGIAIALAAVLLYQSLHGVDWAHVWAAILGAHWGFLAAGALTSVASYILRAMRWRILLNAGGAGRLPAAAVFRANMAGYLGNAVLPARAGEVIRSWIVSGQFKLSRTYVLTTAAGERIFDAIVLVVCGSVALLQVASTPPWMAGVARTMAVAAGGGVLVLAVLPHAEPLVHRVVRWKRVVGLVDQVLLGLRAFHHMGRFLGFTGFTIVIWAVDACGLMLAGRGLDLGMGFLAAMLLLAAMGLGSALPSTPGYVGIYQFVTVTTLAPFGVGREAAIAYSLVTQALAYLVVVVLGAPGLYRFLARR